MHARKNKEGGNQMKDNELLFDRKSHVLYSKPCKKEIQSKIALHYPEAEREAVWERVQLRYAELLSDWRTDLGGKKELPQRRRRHLRLHRHHELLCGLQSSYFVP